MDYRSMINLYIDDNPDKRKEHESKLKDFVSFYENESAEKADAVLLKSYAEKLSGKYKESTISKKIIPECKKFIRWCEAQKGEDKMTDIQNEGHDAQEVISDMATVNEVNEVNEVQKGRKLKGNEARTQKVSLYMPPSLYEQLNDLAHFGRKSVGDILIGLTEEYVRLNAKKLEIFHRAIQEANEAE